MSFMEPFAYPNQYWPNGVHKILACGSTAFIGKIDDFTVLKYPRERGYLACIEHEHRLLEIVGSHERIIAIAGQGLTDCGLYLERASNGDLATFVLGSRQGDMSLRNRIAWCRELVEALVHVHSKRVIHCDVRPANVLLDDDLHIKLADFQGCLLDDNGEVLVSTLVGEPWRYYCPRNESTEMPSPKTDIFALGSTIHFIMTGEEVFDDIKTGEVDWDKKIQSRFTEGVFPDDEHPLAMITRKCWMQRYGSASEVLEEIERVERNWTRLF
ncbi:hypothetical protein CP533_3447 [Ophiocordyceps camponoti-saundersi (nom. inval.)]|nr:hypothetical protein CP533_3447 [Ophiocordyceps camponoti-saundersi (nom. inval.)]